MRTLPIKASIFKKEGEYMMNYLIFIYLIFDQLYVVLASLLKIEFVSTAKTSLYVYLKILLAVITLVVTVSKFLIDGKIYKKVVYTILFISVLIISLLITDLRYGFQLFTKSSLISISYLMPFLLLLSFTNTKDISLLINKYLKYVVFGVTVTSIIYLIIPNIQHMELKSLYGVSYQTSSYIFATNALVSLYYILNTKRLMGGISAYILYLINVISLFMCGGKGAAIVLILGTMGLLIKFPNKNALRFTLLLSLSLTLAGGLIFSNDRFKQGMERAFSFIDFQAKTISWENSSQRNIIFVDAFKVFAEKPIIGWGIGGSYFTPLGNYPHNLFLEVLIDGGIFYALMWVLLVGYSLFYFLRVEGWWLFKILLFTNIMMMMFSSSYLLGNYAFWMFLYSSLENLTINNREKSKNDLGLEVR